MASILAALSVTALALASASPLLADDELDPQRCLSLGGVRTTRIVDDDRILFYLRSGRIYLNSFDRRCPGLARNGKFTYQVQSGARHVRVCSTDNITVLERTGYGFTCGLGDFVPVSAEVVAEMLGEGDAAGKIDAVEASPEHSAERAVLSEPAAADTVESADTVQDAGSDRAAGSSDKRRRRNR